MLWQRWWRRSRLGPGRPAFASSEIAEELRDHLDRQTAAYQAEGILESEARRRARVDFGGVERTRERCYEARPGWWYESLLQDVRYALRGFRRNPAFTLTVLATLTLGIGAATAVFSVVDRILFRPLPYAHGDRLVSIGISHSLQKQEFTLGGFFFDWRDHQTPFSDVTYERNVGECSLSEANPLPLLCARVAQNFLPTLRVTPVLGRNFIPEEDLPNGPEAVLLSYGLWNTRYSRDPGILNRTLLLDDHPYRIAGVLPADFELPRLQKFDLLVPAQTDIAAQHSVNSGIGVPIWAFARLRP